MTTVIKTEKLGKKYKDTYALSNANLEIQKGDIYGIVGPNGAGKSTLLKLLSGITLPSEGKITLFNEENLDTQRKRMSAIVENPTLFGDMSARDNLEYFRIQRGIADRKLIDALLKEVGLHDVGKKAVKKFSVGMKQRLAIALSLLSNPEILILDEPTSGIDPTGIVQIRHLLQRINRERDVTILISSHILSELENLATKVAIISEGVIKEQFELSDLSDKAGEYIFLKTNDNNKALAVLEDKLKLKDFDVKINGEIFIYDAVDKVENLVKTLVENDIGVQSIIKEHQNLEEFYIDVTTQKGA